MRKQLRKIALAVVFTMAVSLFAPAEQVALAAAKTFTYAEQKTGDKVTSLFMERGEKVDLKFMGISDYKNYTLKWVSSNEKVAVVDSNGVITALSNGTTTVKLNVGDGKNYSSMGVIVHVGKEQQITIGTAAKEEIKSYTLEMGKSVMLKANGLEDNVGNRYTCTWTSTDTSVAKISSTGLVTTVAPGLTVIQLSVKKTATNEVMVATPIALQVTAVGGSSTPVATATPTPTRIPWATATPTPKPTVAPTATPTPVVETGSYSVTVTSDKTITLTFPQASSYTVDDLELSMILEADNNDILVKQDLSSVESTNDGKQLIVTTVSNLTTGRYNIKVGSETQGRTFPVSIGVPNRLEIIYTCLGRTNTAYAYDDEVGLDVPVNLEYKLYYGNIDVTASYTDSGFIEYEMVTPTESEDVSLEGDQIYFYEPKKTAVIRGTFTYYTEGNTTKELKDTVSIISKEIGDYTITHVADWTIIDTTENKAIDWDNPVKKVVADKDNYKVVALLADSYGYYYSTDELGVDKSKNIYSVNDDETLFALKGYTYAFNTSNDDYFYIDDNGDLYTYKAKQNAAVYITLYNSDEWATGERNVGAWQFTILAESKLNKVEIEESSVMLLTEALDGFEERFCEAEIPVKLYDQYNYEWDGDAYLEVSSTTSSVNNSIESVASVDKNENGERILHIDGKTMYALAKKSSVSLSVTDSETKKKDSITVQLKSPVTKSKDVIEVDDWAVGMKEDTITFGDGNLSEVSAKAEIEIYQVSKTGNYNVGLVTNGNLDENDNVNVIKLQTKKDPGTSFWSSCTPGEIYVLVLGPDNKIVEEADSSTDLGVWIDKTTGKVTVNLTSSDGNNLTCMEEGTYTVKITRVNKSNGSKLMKPTSFTVVDNTKDVTFAGLKGARTEEDISNEDDAKQVVVELMNFRLGDAAWTTLTENMITKVNYEPRSNNKIYITSIEFAVPADGKSESGVVTYKKTVNIRKSITFGVDD